jgi:hypothetical protein
MILIDNIGNFHQNCQNCFNFLYHGFSAKTARKNIKSAEIGV